jgi:hypothetical protein
VLPSSLQTSSFDISAFLAVPPQDYRTGVQFQLPAELLGARAGIAPSRWPT